MNGGKKYYRQQASEIRKTFIETAAIRRSYIMENSVWYCEQSLCMMFRLGCKPSHLNLREEISWYGNYEPSSEENVWM
jgi:hypothetical protein